MKYLIHELCFRIVRVLQLSTTMIMFQDLDKGYYRMNMTMFLDCEDCGGEYEGDCPIHGPLVIIKDTKVRWLSDRQIIDRYRIGRDNIVFLCNLLADELRRPTARCKAIPPHLQVGCNFRTYGYICL